MTETTPPPYNADVESQNKGKQIVINCDSCCTKKCFDDCIAWIGILGVILGIPVTMILVIYSNDGKCLLASAPTLMEDDRYDHMIEFSTYFSSDCEAEFNEEISGIVYYSENFNLISTTRR